MVVKRLAWIVACSALLLVPPAVVAQQPTLFRINPKDPLDHKAVLALVRGLRGAGVDTAGVRLVSTDQFNAFYMGNRLFVAGKPMLQLPQWAVDAVMAHEVGHLMNRHIEQEAALRGGLAETLQGLGMLLDRDHPDDGAAVGGAIAHTVAELVIPKFTQRQELEADAYGVRVLRAEGYKQPGEAMRRALALIERAVGPSGGGFFDTHPSFEERINRLRQADVTP
jgi:putative metalloprotease